MSRATQENIKRLLAITGATHQQLADIAGVDRSAVSHWKSGKSEPRMGHLQKIADYYGIKVYNLSDPNGMAFVHKGVDGNLHEDRSARVSQIFRTLLDMRADDLDGDAINVEQLLNSNIEIHHKLEKSEVELLDMFRSLNEEGQNLVLSTVAAFVNSGSYKACK